MNGQLGVSRAIGDFHFEGLKYKTNGTGPTKGPLTAGAYHLNPKPWKFYLTSFQHAVAGEGTNFSCCSPCRKQDIP